VHTWKTLLGLTLIACFIANAETPASSGHSASPSAGGVIPYFADGGGWTTLFGITCLSNPGCAVSFVYIGSNGQRAAIPAKVTLPGPSGESVSQGNQSSIIMPLTFGQTGLIETQGQGSTTVTGAIDINSNSLLAGFSTFRQRVAGHPDFEATVLMDDRAFNGRFVVSFDNRDGFTTGVALTNLTNNVRADVVITGVDLSNKALFTGLISLDPLNGTTFNVSERFPATAGKVGILNFSAQGAFITGTGFRFNPNGAFTTLPIFQLR
jgi:hypothetical protein